MRDGDEWVINGQKIFTSLATDADYIWLAVRTEPRGAEAQGHLDDHRADRHARLHACSRSTTSATVNTNNTFYDDVRVPVGEPGRRGERRLGLITNQLNHERVTLCASGMIERSFDDVRALGAGARALADGRRVIDQQWVQLNLAWVHARLEFLRLLNWQVAWNARAARRSNPADASTIKVFGTEFYMEAVAAAARGDRARRRRCATARPTRCCAAGSRRCCARLHVLTFGGGTNEMQRDLIAIFGLSMPGSPR